MMNFEGVQDLGGASAQNETQAPEEKVVNLEEQKKKRQPFAYWNVGGRSFKMKLKASGIGRLENKYRQNLMNMIDDIPPLSVMLTIIQEAMSPWEHGIDYQDAQKLYDAWIDEGNSQLELYQKILIPLMVVSGFLPEKTAASLLEEIENA
ncbi:MAG: tail assembly chaperone protein [Bacteriophage sp.]|nr:MAG: tail assembly chaperone protein [Bacteriophage sp.]